MKKEETKAKSISIHALCPLTSCNRNNTCARYTRYLKAMAESDTFEIMNPTLLQVSGENCPYYLIAQKQRFARGFVRIYNSIPAGNTKYFANSTPYTRRRFYKAKNGEFLIEPEMQRKLLKVFERHGADMSIGFDAYEEKEELVEE